jgi:hypothetical protein
MLIVALLADMVICSVVLIIVIPFPFELFMLQKFPAPLFLPTLSSTKEDKNTSYMMGGPSKHPPTSALFDCACVMTTMLLAISLSVAPWMVDCVAQIILLFSIYLLPCLTLNYNIF